MIANLPIIALILRFKNLTRSSLFCSSSVHKETNCCVVFLRFAVFKVSEGSFFSLNLLLLTEI